MKYSPDGKRCWDYQVVHCAFAWTAENYFPGYLVGAIGFCSGATKDLIGVTGYYGHYFLLDKQDGLFVDALGDDQRAPYTLDQHMVLTENFNGMIFQHPNSKTYFNGGDADARLWGTHRPGEYAAAERDAAGERGDGRCIAAKRARGDGGGAE